MGWGSWGKRERGMGQQGGEAAASVLLRAEDDMRIGSGRTERVASG